VSKTVPKSMRSDFMRAEFLKEICAMFKIGAMF